ncbi:hypothetical protein PhCBS80983_g04291 [Powellomyces hirtus]|uniref:Testis-expressed sequence 9 protein n=1 Tax=Powellomyces hirtus TaxID=109895 RepID=A0A507DYB6_9FUNG|nr:hypothetical protein PhCBS80983_g04291 [Powellomyces hirtus]
MDSPHLGQDYANKEARRLNKELQSKSARAVRDAEEVVKEGKAALVRPMTAPNASKAAENGNGPASEASKRPTTSAGAAGKAVKPKLKSASKPQSAIHKRPSTTSGLRGPSPEDDVTHMAESSRHPLGDNACDDIGSEASNRLLKAKLQVMERDMNKLISQHEVKNATILSLEQKVKALESEKSKNVRTFQTMHSQTNKYQTQIEDWKRRAENAEAEVLTLKKNLDAQNRAQRHSETEGNAKDVRLNRALDEIERQKQLAAKASTDAKDKLEESKRGSQKLLQDYRRTQKQKGELLTAFKKQSQLIDVLKRQKIHLESAKLLEIAEQDFVRALNWEV